MTGEFNPIKAQSEKLAGLNEAMKTVHVMVRAAERKAAESAAALDALLKVRAAMTEWVEQEQVKLERLEADAEAKQTVAP